MRTITLQFSSLLVALAGNPYGKKEFNNQVRAYIGDDLDYCLIFPEHIEYVVS